MTAEWNARGDAGYQVTEFEGGDPEWMFELATNSAFERIPAANLQQLFQRFEAIEVTAGQVVIRLGEPGDYYYLIRKGRAQVARPTPDGKTILIELGPGQGFGEEALLSGRPRNATVTMLQDGMLMRLAAADFDMLLRPPLVTDMAADEAIALLHGGAQLVDVRTEAEFQQGSLHGAINIPLLQVRSRAETLERQRPYLLFCDDGRRAATAAFLLAQRGFVTHVLGHGIQALQKKSGTPDNS
jgi:CRP-like cAMP-binding protein